MRRVQKRSIRVALIRGQYFLWVLVPIALYAGLLQIGLPHIVWEYSFTSPGQTMDPFAPRIYHRCSYWGPYGNFDVTARHGRCPELHRCRSAEARRACPHRLCPERGAPPGTDPGARWSAAPRP